LLVSTTYCRGDAYYWTYNRGRHAFSFSLQTHDGNWHAARSYGIGWESWSPLRVVRSQARVVSVPHRRCLPEQKEYLRCDHPGVVATVLKEVYDRTGHVIRVFNVTAERVSTELELAFPIASAEACDMNERSRGSAFWHGNRLQLSLDPHEIATYRLQLEA
jgi:alpha-mannosidase